MTCHLIHRDTICLEHWHCGGPGERREGKDGGEGEGEGEGEGGGEGRSRAGK